MNPSQAQTEAYISGRFGWVLIIFITNYPYATILPRRTPPTAG
jgi:hypothetical protein